MTTIDLLYSSDVDSTWALQRVGSQGQLVLLRAVKNEDSAGISITASPLQGIDCTMYIDKYNYYVLYI
jgi:hypothetical protein